MAPLRYDMIKICKNEELEFYDSIFANYLAEWFIDICKI